MQTAFLLETRLGIPQDDTADLIRNMLSELGKSAKPRLLLHAHGGLVDANSARIEALGMEMTFRPELPDWSRGYFIWHTDIREQIIKGLTAYDDDALARRVHHHVRAWADERAAATGKARGGSSEPEIADPKEIQARLRAVGEADAEGDPQEDAIAREIERRLASDPEYLSLCAAIDEAARDTPGPTSPNAPAALALSRLDPEVRREIERRAVGRGGAPAQSVVSVRAGLAALRIVLRFLAKRDHGLQATVLEEVVRLLYLDIIGARVWQNMKDDAAAHMAPGGAGAAILDGLEAIAAGGKTVEVVFVGHSAGAVLGLHFLRAAAALSKRIKVSQIFWAAAATHKLTAELLDPPTAARLSHFALLSLTDGYEKADALDNVVPGNPYPRSLPYLISGVLEPDLAVFPHADAPLLGMERHRVLKDKRLTSRERKARAHIRQMLQRFPDYAWTCKCAGDCGNTSHGSFGRDTGVHRTTARLIKTNFTAKPACPGQT